MTEQIPSRDCHVTSMDSAAWEATDPKEATMRGHRQFGRLYMLHSAGVPPGWFDLEAYYKWRIADLLAEVHRQRERYLTGKVTIQTLEGLCTSYRREIREAADMASFSASDEAAYEYPGEDQQALRVAFCAGAAAIFRTPR